MTNPNDDLILVERMLLKMGTVDTDEELETCLDKMLPHTISMLTNSTESLQSRVLELLTHINKRLKSRPCVQVPVEKILALYQQPLASAYIVNFAMIYIKLGFPRLPPEKRVDLLPELVSAANTPKPSSTDPSHSLSLIFLFLGSLHLAKFKEQSNKTFESLNQSPRASTIILDLMQNILLYPYGWKGGEEAPAEISRTSYKQLLSNLPEISKSEYLEKLKVTCLKMLTCGVYPERKIFTLLVIASADARSSVFGVADTHLRKISQEEEKFVEGLYSVYLGGGGGTGDTKRGHASTRLRLKLLPYMAKSPHLPWPQALQVLFDSLYGENTNMKLRVLALNYCLNLINNVGMKQLIPVGEVILNSGLLQLVKSDWAEPPLVRQAFNCIGNLVSKLPQLASESLLKSLFYVLSQERDQEVCGSVRDCVVRMALSYKQEGECPWLEKLVSEGLGRTHSPKAMAAALHYLTHSLAHTTSRIYLLLISSNHTDHEVSTSAKKALYGVNYANGGLLPSDIPLPPFDQLLSLILDKELSKPVDSNLHPQMVLYLRLCLAKSAGAPASLDLLDHPCEHSPLLSSYLASLHANNDSILSRYIQFLFNIINKNLCVITLAAVVECLGCLPDVVRPLLEDKMTKILGEQNHSKEEVRRLWSQLIALGVSSQSLEGLISEMLGQIDKSSSAVEKTHGALLTVGYAVQRAKHFPPSSSSLFKNIVGCLESSQQVVVGGACQAIALSAVATPLPLSEDEKLSLVNQLLDILFSTKHSTKIKELSCTALGNLCVGENFPHREKITNHFIEHVKEVKDISLVLSMGEGLVACVLGSSGTAGLDPWTQTPSPHLSPPPSPDLVALELLSSVSALVPVPHPNSRQCCCFWLLSITKHCSHLKSIKEQLQNIQNAFMELLSDQSSLVQEAASRGLALVYQNGGEGLDRSQLLSRLVNQLMSGKRSVNQVSQDTQLFEEGQLGSSPIGGNLSTYKELCSLASDLNKPDLIYKFMSLANHNAVWNSKKGAAFGVSTLVDLAGPEIEDHLPNIIAKLYRYQYDPTPSIQQTMSGIWHAFTSNIPNAVEKYSVEIFKDLKSNITSPQWRVRQSSCKALTDFMRSPASNKPLFEACLDEMADLWLQLFRVMDDVHEATRESAVSTTKTLARICVRECEKTSPHREQLAAVILPVILNKGIKSSVAEVRAVSVTTLSDLVKAGVASKEVTTLVPALLIAAQELESTSLSHLSVMVSGSQAAQEVVDSARASAIKSHFTVQTLNKCVEFIKPEMMEELAPQLVDMLKSSVGLGARLATCHFLILLSHQTPLEHIQPYIGKFLAGLLHGLVDRNTVVRKQYAQTIGQLCRYAKDQSIDRLLTKLSQLYFDKEDDGVRLTVGLTLQAMTSQNQEAIKSRSAVVLPLAFFAKHHLKPADGNVDGGVGEKLVEVWEEVCDDVGGLSGVVTFASPIADLLLTCLQAPEWAAKAQSGRGVETLANKAGEALPVEVRSRLVGGVIASLAGRTWDNKHFLLRALIPLARHNKNSDECFSIVIALEKECEREKVEYKKHALKALGDALHILNINRFNSVYAIIQNIISSRGEQRKSEGDEDSSNSSSDLLDSAYELLGKAWPADDPDIQERMVEEVVSSLVARLGSVPRSTQAAILNSIVLIMEKLSCLQAPAWNSTACLATSQASQAIQFAFSVSKHTNLRKAALNLLMLLINRTKDKSEEDLVKLESIFSSFKEELEKDTSAEVRSRLADTKEAFQKCKNH